MTIHPGDYFISRSGQLGARVESVDDQRIYMHRWKVGDLSPVIRFSLTFEEFSESSWVAADPVSGPPDDSRRSPNP